MYILKTKGTEKIPDYIQIRNADFVLIYHFRTDRVQKALENSKCKEYIPKIQEIVNNLEYGKLKKMEL